MPTSLFGRSERPAPREDEDPRWQSTLPEGEFTAPAAAPEPAERNVQDLFLSGSPAEALRVHLAGAGEPPADREAITLFDPVRSWAPALLKSLSDTGGQPLERLALRDATGLQTMATIERTRVVRRGEATLKVYHVDVPSGVGDGASVPLAMMERSQLGVVIVGPMHPESVTGMLEQLLAATHAESWRCPNLLFVLPPAAVWIANRVSGMGWPQPLKVTVLNESLGSASAVWNALLGIWARAKDAPPWAPEPTQADAFEPPLPPIHVEPAPAEALPRIRLDLDGSESASAVTRASPTLDPLDLQRASAVLLDLLLQEGVIGCALVDAGSGLPLVRQVRDSPVLDIDRVAAAATQVLRSHRVAARESGFTEPVEEIMVSAGSRQQLLRLLPERPGLFVCAVIDSRRGNLALTRYKLIEVRRALG